MYVTKLTLNEVRIGELRKRGLQDPQGQNPARM
jgi:hypothetical protein